MDSVPALRKTPPIRPPVQGDGSVLEVKSIFPTLQGEGPLAGMPAVFVRLGGCNLACDFCDTEYEGFSSMGMEEILVRVEALAKEKASRLVVITGGEPLRQNIAPLCERLITRNFHVQIETNGTLMRELPEGVDIVCSPKHTGGGYMPLREDLLPRLSALKFIISARHPFYREVAEVGQSRYDIPVYVQPMDEGDAGLNRANTELALQLAQSRGYRLSLQLHKILGIE